MDMLSWKGQQNIQMMCISKCVYKEGVKEVQTGNAEWNQPQNNRLKPNKAKYVKNV